jgi:hypothetical protein
MPARRTASIFLPLALPLVFLVSACAADSDQQETTSDATAVTSPTCEPAANDSPGECQSTPDSDALLKENIGQCAFGNDAVSRDWTQDYGWIWWNAAEPGSTAAVGLELETGRVVCT